MELSRGKKRPDHHRQHTDPLRLLAVDETWSSKSFSTIKPSEILSCCSHVTSSECWLLRASNSIGNKGPSQTARVVALCWASLEFISSHCEHSYRQLDQKIELWRKNEYTDSIIRCGRVAWRDSSSLLMSRKRWSLPKENIRHEHLYMMLKVSI